MGHERRQNGFLRSQESGEDVLSRRLKWSDLVRHVVFLVYGRMKRRDLVGTCVREGLSSLSLVLRREAYRSLINSFPDEK